MIHYFAFYATKDSGRVANLAGEDKIDYICEVINQTGRNVTIVSNSRSAVRRFLPREKKKLCNGSQLLMFSTLPRLNRVVRALDVLWGFIQLVHYVFTQVGKNDVVLVYHSLGYRNIFNYLRKLKKFWYILEVEEIFAYIHASKSSFKNKENRVFIGPDGYIFSNEILAQKINVNHKPQVTINGVYRMEHPLKEKTKTDKTIVVYAGSLEKQKGVDYIIKCAPYLSGNHEIRIIGFGGEEDFKRVKGLIDQMNERSKCKTFYDGVLKGEKYKEYLQVCDIGVCIQDEEDEFNQFEFPSKIFSYLTNGLSVVVNRLVQVEASAIGADLYVTEGKSPEQIAKCISICTEDTSKEKTMITLERLNQEFTSNMDKLLRTPNIGDLC